MERYRGFVIGKEPRPGSRPTWWVRVKDARSLYDQQKFAVASMHDDIELARGLNVTFVVGTIDDERGQKVMRAVDVRLETPDPQPHQREVNQSESQKEVKSGEAEQ